MFDFGSGVSGRLLPRSSTRTSTAPARRPPPVSADSVPHHLDSESGFSPERQMQLPAS